MIWPFPLSISTLRAQRERAQNARAVKPGQRVRRGDYGLCPYARPFAYKCNNGRDRFIVPVVPQYLALEGLATLDDALERIKAGIGCSASMMGILLTQVDKRNKSTAEIISIIRQHYGDRVFKTEVKTNTRLSEAPSFGKTIFQHDWAATGAQAYQALAGEVLTKIKEKK